MQQRVALARCLINDPDLILMDEVRIMMKNLNGDFSDKSKVVDLNWESFTYLISKKYEEDLEGHK